MLWTLGILALLGAAVTGAGRQEARLASALRGGDAARETAEAALFQTCFELLAGRTEPDGVVRVVPVGAARATVAARSENGKLNPNTAPAELLATLLRLVGAPAADAAQVAAAIAAWRQGTTDGEPDPAVLGTYRAAGRRYGPTGQPFRDVGDLRLVLGMTPALFAAAAPHLSVFPTGVLDPAAADPVVRQALRLSGVGNGTAQGVNQGVNQGANQGANQGGTLSGGPRIVSVSVAASLPGGGSARIEAVVLLDASTPGRPVSVLAWDEV